MMGIAALHPSYGLLAIFGEWRITLSLIRPTDLTVIRMVADVTARFASYLSSQLDKSEERAHTSRVQIFFLLFPFVFLLLFFLLSPHHCLEVFICLLDPLRGSRFFPICLNSFKADFSGRKTDQKLLSDL